EILESQQQLIIKLNKTMANFYLDTAPARLAYFDIELSEGKITEEEARKGREAIHKERDWAELVLAATSFSENSILMENSPNIRQGK
ncbi:MAG: hypothetical protein LBU89_03595, partial [Fibromonadaceae bacterium]|nr:hypothetical protein [Fibromonadaceae bacterium]